MYIFNTLLLGDAEAGVLGPLLEQQHLTIKAEALGWAIVTRVLQRPLSSRPTPSTPVLVRLNFLHFVVSFLCVCTGYFL